MADNSKQSSYFFSESYWKLWKEKILMENRIKNHPILGIEEKSEWVQIEVDGKKLKAKKGEMIIAALMANEIYKCPYLYYPGERRNGH